MYTCKEKSKIFTHSSNKGKKMTFLDVNPPMSGRYRLEISSPGIERKLIKPVHFQNAISEKIKFKLGDGNKLKGTLISANNKSVTVETKAGEETYVYVDLNTCKTYFEW